MDHLERFASDLAEWCNGGSWNWDYTDIQKEIWRKRAQAVRKSPDEMDMIGLVAALPDKEG